MSSISRKDGPGFSFAVGLVFIIWLVSSLDLLGLWAGHVPLLLPRTISGLAGIPFVPFLHGDIPHLLSNTIPLFVFSLLVSLKGRVYFLKVTLSIIFLSGVLIWLMGRPAYHIGASTLIFGYFGFLLARVFYDRKPVTAIVSIVVAIVYGGLIWGVLPQGNHISWEGHLFGLIAGTIVAKSTTHTRA